MEDSNQCSHKMICITNLDNMTAEQLRKEFNYFGTITFVEVIHMDASSTGYVGFSTTESAEKAVKHMNDHLIGEKQVQVTLFQLDNQQPAKNKLSNIPMDEIKSQKMLGHSKSVNIQQALEQHPSKLLKIRMTMASQCPLLLKNVYKSKGVPCFYYMIDSDIVEREVKKTYPSIYRIMPQHQKEVMRKKLLPLITKVAPKLAEKITEMFLQYTSSKLDYMLGDNKYLTKEVCEAIVTLKVCEAKAAQVQKEKQILGAELYPLIRDMYPHCAMKLTELLLQLNKSKLLFLLEHNDHLKANVEMAFSVFEALIKTKEEMQDMQITENDKMQNMESKLFPLIAINKYQAEAVLDESVYPVVHEELLYPALTNELLKLVKYINNFKLVHILQQKNTLSDKIKEAVQMLCTFVVEMTEFVGEEKVILDQELYQLAYST